MLAIMRTRIKICCIASIDEAQLAIAAGADAQDEQAPQMIARHAPRIHAFLLKPGSSPDWAACARLVRPYGVDLCASVRTDGQLDIMKLALLTSAVREADALLYAEG